VNLNIANKRINKQINIKGNFERDYIKLMMGGITYVKKKGGITIIKEQ